MGPYGDLINIAALPGPSMKIVYLLRHAKSSWVDTPLPDRDRPLAPRGKRNARKMSKRWSQQHEKPELIMSSPATRTLATAKIVARGLEYKTKNIMVDDRLYDATAHALIAVIESLDERLDRVMLVGHNPGFAELAHHFDNKITHMPTCALAEFGFVAESWAGIGRVKPVRTSFDSPKQRSPARSGDVGRS
jgi:phosphohistidine phosphatase